MRHIYYILILIVINGCLQTKNNNNQSDSLKSNINKIDSQSMNLVDSRSNMIVKSDINDDSKLNIDSLLNKKNNDYLATFKNGELSMCCYEILKTDVLDLKMFKKTSEEYSEDYGIKKVDVYVYEDSYIKQFYNTHPQVNRLDLVSGKILSDKIELSNGIRIGMYKADLIGKIFKKSGFFDSVNILTIYENEIGDNWTSYIFKDNKLIEIKFDSSYDWIEKGLKK